MEGTCGYCFWRIWRETVGVHTVLQFTHIWTSQRIHLTYNSFKMKKMESRVTCSGNCESTKELHRSRKRISVMQSETGERAEVGARLETQAYSPSLHAH